MKNTLNRKYLMQAIDASLERLAVDFVDLIFCHRADPNTPIEETVWAMHDIVSSGKALYWGTSEWAADQIHAAWEIAERHHLHKPVMEQPEYNLLEARPRRARIRQALHRYRSRSHHVQPARLRLADRQVQRRDSVRFPWRVERLRVARQAASRSCRSATRSSDFVRSPTISVVRSLRCVSPGVPATPTCRV